MNTKTVLSMLVALTVITLGCSGQAPEETAAAPQQAAEASHASAAGPEMVTGEVVETMNSGGYTYVKVATAEREFWAATSEFEVAEGDRVTLPLEWPMQDFHSNTLDRDFPEIYFASFIAPEGEAPAAAGHGMTGMPAGHPPTGPTASTGAQDVDAAAIKRPADALSIAEVWNRRAELNGTSVTVAGQVMKYTAEVLDRNWLHIQDGTGDSEEGSNDLTVTTTSTVAVGDLVIVTGTLVIDKDLGSGYFYSVLLEDAAVEQQ